MPPKYVTFYKKQGQTPLEVIDELKANHKDWASLPMTYAGRLDPMAEGLMIILIGEECKNKEKYLGLDKVYEFEILFGFESDTFDLLGLVKDNEQKEKIELFDSESFKETLNSFIGKQIQKYPSYSSKTVDGESLFSLAKKATLPKNLPDHEVEIYDLELLENYSISKIDLEKSIIEKINSVNTNADFRQKDIKTKWTDVLSQSSSTHFTVLKCVANVSSGTYIRQLVSDIGEKISIPTVTYSIKRTKVGEFNSDDEIVIQ